MASKKTSTVEKLKNLVAPKAKTVSKPKENFETGIKLKGIKSKAFDGDETFQKLEKALTAKGITIKVEAAHHLNVTLVKHVGDATAHLSMQIAGGKFTEADAKAILKKVSEELGG